MRQENNYACVAYDCGLPAQAFNLKLKSHSAARISSINGGNLISINFILNRLHKIGFLLDTAYDDIDLAWILDLSGRYILVHGNRRGFLGFNPGEYMKKKFFEQIIDSERDMYLAHYRIIISKNLFFRNLIVCRKSKTGEMVFSEIAGCPVISSDNKPTGFCGISKVIINSKGGYYENNAFDYNNNIYDRRM